MTMLRVVLNFLSPERARSLMAYVPSGSRRPMLSVPSHLVLKKPLGLAMSSSSTTTGWPPLSISRVTRLGLWRRMLIRALSRRPSRFGLKRIVAWKRVTIGGGVGKANGSRNTPSAITNSASMAVATIARRARSRPPTGAVVISEGPEPQADVEAEAPERRARAASSARRGPAKR